LLLALVLAQCAQRGSLGAIEAKRGKVLGYERVHGNVSPGWVNRAIIFTKWGIVSKNTSLPVFDYPIPNAHPSAKANGKGTALKGQRPYPEKETSRNRPRRLKVSNVDQRFGRPDLGVGE